METKMTIIQFIALWFAIGLPVNIIVTKILDEQVTVKTLLVCFLIAIIWPVSIFILIKETVWQSDFLDKKLF